MEHDTSVRVKAPIGEVWSEVVHLDDVFRRAPDFIRVIGMGGEGQVLLQGRLGWGPVSRTLDSSARVESAIPPHQLTFSMVLPSLDVDAMGVIDLTQIAENETSLRLSAQLTCGHRQLSKLRGMFSDYLEDFVDTTASRLATLAAQHWQSKQQLLFRPGPARG